MDTVISVSTVTIKFGFYLFYCVSTRRTRELPSPTILYLIHFCPSRLLSPRPCVVRFDLLGFSIPCVTEPYLLEVTGIFKSETPSCFVILQRSSSLRYTDSWVKWGTYCGSSFTLTSLYEIGLWFSWSVLWSGVLSFYQGYLFISYSVLNSLLVICNRNILWFLSYVRISETPCDVSSTGLFTDECPRCISTVLSRESEQSYLLGHFTSTYSFPNLLSRLRHSGNVVLVLLLFSPVFPLFNPLFFCYLIPLF